MSELSKWSKVFEDENPEMKKQFVFFNPVKSIYEVSDQAPWNFNFMAIYEVNSAWHMFKKYVIPQRNRTGV